MTRFPRLERSRSVSGRAVSVLVPVSAMLRDLEIGRVEKSWTGDDGRVEAGVADSDETSRIAELVWDELRGSIRINAHGTL